MATTTYGDISQRTAAYAAVEMLEHARPVIVLSDYGQPKPLPRNKADNVKFRRPVPFTVSTTQLSEGVTPTSQQMNYADVPATLGQYGAVCEITDKVDDLSEDPVLKDASMLSGEQAAETIELVTWGVLKGGTNVIYTGNAVTSRANIVGVITLTDQRTATRFLKGQRGKKITSRVSSSVKYGSEPIDAAYLAFAHTDMESDIRDLAGFTPTEKYGSMAALPYECGKVEDVRYILSPVLEAFTGATDSGNTNTTGLENDGTYANIYPDIYIAKEASGLVPLRGEGAITPMVLNPGKPSKSDPLGQRGYVSWKAYFVAVRLNEAWMVRVETGASDLNDVS